MEVLDLQEEGGEQNKRDGVGSLWRKWDLHIHTPASFHWKGTRFRDLDATGRAVECEKIIAKLNSVDVAVFGIMDYWTFDGFLELRKYLEANPTEKKKCILPGIELRLEMPTDYRLNTHVIFSDLVSDTQLSHFLGNLRMGGSTKRAPSEENFIALGKDYDDGKLKSHGYKPTDRSDEAKMLELGMKTALVTRESLREAMKLIGPENCLMIQPYDTSDGAEKLDWEKHPSDDRDLMHWADIFEAKNPEVIDLFLGKGNAKKPDAAKDFMRNLGGYPKPVVRGSDAHTVNDYGVYPNDRITWLKAEPTFEGLKQVCYEPGARCFIGICPPKLAQVNAHPTRYMRRLEARRTADAKTQEKWFDGVGIEINPGLVSIIGNKGGGKSALADILALLGNSLVPKMEFLNDERFRKGQSLSSYFSATLTWEDGQEQTKRLSDGSDPERPERVRYLPQLSIENLCNEIAQGGGTQFEIEMKKVIFFHVPSEEKLGKETLDELITYKTETTKATIRQLQQKLSALNVEIADLERDTSKETVASYTNSLQLKKDELAAHDKAIPAVVEQPKATDAENAATASTVKDIDLLKAELEKTQGEIRSLVAERAGVVAKQAAIVRIKAKLENLERDFGTFRSGSSADFTLAGISQDAVTSLNIHREPITKAESDAAARLQEVDSAINGIPDKPGLRAKETELTGKIKALQENLAAPQKRYQAYLEQRTIWDKRRAEIVGNAARVDTLDYYQTKIAASGGALLTELAAKRVSRINAVREIHAECLKLRDVYGHYYKYVQDIASKNGFTSDGLQLDFSSYLSAGQFEERFFAFINQGRRGTFYGADEGRRALRETLVRYDMNDTEQVVAFVGAVDAALVADRRDPKAEALTLASQLKSGFKAQNFYDLLYSLDYLEPRYTLKLAGKEIGQLSPGEKGALLLVFYLLLDKEDIPIIIDQPEQNLDNQSVVRLLVDCIKQARDRRQVIMVTHNPNLAVVCDSDQLIYAQIDKADGNKVTYKSGAIEERHMNKLSVDILEGTYPAFQNRKRKYMRPASD